MQPAHVSLWLRPPKRPQEAGSQISITYFSERACDLHCSEKCHSVLHNLPYDFGKKMGEKSYGRRRVRQLVQVQ